jgi:hypothetical protein
MKKSPISATILQQITSNSLKIRINSFDIDAHELTTFSAAESFLAEQMDFSIYALGIIKVRNTEIAKIWALFI